jgi:TatD DNase family protein
MNSRYIDIHSHLNLPQFDADREEIIQKLKDENVWTITVGDNYKTSLFAVELAKKHENLYACVGLHPSEVLVEEFNYEEMLSLAKEKRVVAIGECGLDYFRESDEAFKIKQKEIFHLHVKLALGVGKPLMIHARPSKGTMDAYEDVLDILESYKKESRNLMANFHFFSGDMNIAKRILSLGFTMSFDGPITFSNDYDEVIKMTPIESIMAETDSPFASPVPYRGKRAEPHMVKEVIKKIAELKDLTEEEALNKVNNNIKRIFDI